MLNWAWKWFKGGAINYVGLILDFSHEKGMA